MGFCFLGSTESGTNSRRHSEKTATPEEIKRRQEVRDYLDRLHKKTDTTNANSSWWPFGGDKSRASKEAATRQRDAMHKNCLSWQEGIVADCASKPDMSTGLFSRFRRHRNAGSSKTSSLDQSPPPTYLELGADASSKRPSSRWGRASCSLSGAVTGTKSFASTFGNTVKRHCKRWGAEHEAWQTYRSYVRAVQSIERTRVEGVARRVEGIQSECDEGLQSAFTIYMSSMRDQTKGLRSAFSDAISRTEDSGYLSDARTAYNTLIKDLLHDHTESELASADYRNSLAESVLTNAQTLARGHEALVADGRKAIRKARWGF